MVEHPNLTLRNTIFRLIEEHKSIKNLKQVHTQIIKSPFLSKTDHHFLITRLLFVSALSESTSLTYATGIFRFIQTPNLSMYNIMIRAYATKSSDLENTNSIRPLILYKQMLCNNIRPDSLTVPFLLKECTRKLDCFTGSSVHGQSVRFGLYNTVYVQNSLISLYGSCGFFISARNVFDEMVNRDVVSWNSIIIGYLRGGDLDAALGLFNEMSSKKNIITWNSMITGFVQGGRAKEALEFFYRMQVSSIRDGDDDGDMVKPDKITIASVLSACSFLGSIDHGKWVHSYSKRNGLEFDTVIQTALIDMYGKSGSLQKAYAIFTEMTEKQKDTFAFTAMISAFAVHGYVDEAFDVFLQMVDSTVKPNQVTFVALLSACAHSGLVERGLWCFDAMKRVHSIEPRAHHYASMVDILSRAGMFHDAEKLIETMPMEPDRYVWGALLGGCQMHGNVELGERVSKHLIELEPLNHAFYMNLCDLYGKVGRFNDVKRIRGLMKELGVKKDVPGCSMIEIDGVVHEFSVNGSNEVSMEDFVWVLYGLNDEMKRVGDIHRIDKII